MPEIRQRMAAYYRSAEAYRAQLEADSADKAAFYVNWAAGFIPRGCSVLDLGCGIGASTKLFAERGYRPVGADLSPLFLTAAAQSASLPAQFVAADALALPFADAAFDAVASAALIEHLPDVAQALREMLRVLKAGGLLLILAPNPCSLTMPVGDLVSLLRGGAGRPYFAETRSQAIRWLGQNLALNARKLLDREVRFRYVEPDLSVGTGGDHDMVYYASPIDIRCFLTRHGARIVSWSGVRVQPLLQEGSLRLRGSGLKRAVRQALLWPFTETLYVVAQKQPPTADTGIRMER